MIEQVRSFRQPRATSAQAVVVECMALQPHLQWLSESRFLKATHGVITNVRPDHLDVMGPRHEDVAWAMAGTTPVNAALYTAEKEYLSVFEESAKDRGTRLVKVDDEEMAKVTDEEMAKFAYIEHKENVALALRVCKDLGVTRETALKGMWKAPPDPGVMTVCHVRFFGRHIHFVNAFAANDPASTEQLWNLSVGQFPEVEKRIAIFNCRSDRPSRSEQLGRACPHWHPADYYVLIGSGTYFFLKAAVSEGLSLNRMLVIERANENDIFEMVIERAGRAALVVGMGNIKGEGLSLARYFRNRSILKDVAREEVA